MNDTRIPYAVIPSREELRRMRHREERERAKRAENRAAWFKVIAAAIAMTLVTAATFALVHAHNQRVRREVDAALLKAEVYTMMIEAEDAVRRNPDNGLDKFALLTGLALYCMD